MLAARVELLQFPYSHYNEKARWALDYKRVPHSRRSYLPGPHRLAIRRLTGQSQVPVLRIDAEVVAGSARILDELEQRHPDPPLTPTDSALRRRSREIQAWFDEEIGPRIRCALFSVLLDEPGYLCRLFATGRRAAIRLAYRTGFPLVRGLMAREMGLHDAARVEQGFAKTREALDFVAKQAGPEGYLAGAAFSAADLTAAALLAPACNPPDSPMALPAPIPPAVQAWLARWSEHPGRDWVLARYRENRPPSSEQRSR